MGVITQLIFCLILFYLLFLYLFEDKPKIKFIMNGKITVSLPSNVPVGTTIDIVNNTGRILTIQ